MKNPFALLTVVYDNTLYDQKLKSNWGFSCFIQGKGGSILFDTGSDPQILLSNMKDLNIEPKNIDRIVLSHEHKDHTGGLETLLEINPNIEIWLPHTFSQAIKDMARKLGGRIHEVKEFQKIDSGAYTTGVINGWIREQSLILDTEKELVLITGCAHPRIVNILSTTKEIMGEKIGMALGGFHLLGFEKKEILNIIDSFRSLGIGRVGPCHCTGEEARKLFHEEYQNDFINVGTGRRIKIQ